MRVILIDGKNTLYKFGHVNRALHTVHGFPTGALYGFAGAVLRLASKYPKSRLVVAWDGIKQGKSWRSTLFPEYKNNRKPGSLPVDPVVIGMFKQIPVIKEFLSLIRIPQLESEHIEADDLIALMIGMCKKNQWHPVIYSSDRDFIQLMPYGAELIRDTAKCEPVTPEGIKKKFRCSVDDVLRVRSLSGDSSDCIPGVPGIGEVRGAKFVELGAKPELAEFSMLPKWVQADCAKLESHWPAIHRNYRLMRLSLTIAKLPLKQSVRSIISSMLSDVEATILDTETGSQRDYHKFIALLSKYELLDAMGKRHELFELGVR